MSGHSKSSFLFGLKASSPLAKVLRLAHGEKKKPPMGYIYEAQRGQSSFLDNNEENYKEYNLQLHLTLPVVA